MAHIKVKWHYIDWNIGDTWGKDIVPQLDELNLTEEMLERAVYVIRANGNFAIDYPNKPSPALYIGEGNFKNRLSQHKNWLWNLWELVGDFPFEIALSIPRARNNMYAYQDMEADLLHEFKRIYGAAPFMNKKMEYPYGEHEYVPSDEFIKPLQIGKGRRIPWAVRPLRSNKYYEDFLKTSE